MIWLDRLLAEIPKGVLQTVTVQFPDPWFKKKHAKRRMVNAEMIDSIAQHLLPAARFLCRQDIEFLAGRKYLSCLEQIVRFLETLVR
jgi:tRNA (guanine-N7-)-methyltransferase